MLKQLNLNSILDNSDTTVNSQETLSLNDSSSFRLSTNLANRKNMNGFDLSLSAVFILAQTVFSCLAGVYNEYLLKDKGAEVNIFIQNVFMYIDSIVCNAIILLVRGELWQTFSLTNLHTIFRFQVFIIIINNAAIGIVTSFFLKYMNSILKTFASALELLFTAVLCYFLFGIPIYINTALAIAVVSYAIYLYSQSPVVNLGKLGRSGQKTREKHTSDRRKLLDETEDTDLEMDMV